MAKTVKFTSLEQMKAGNIACPTCNAQAFKGCTTKVDTWASSPHVARLKAARTALAAEAAAKVAAKAVREEAARAAEAAAWAEVDARIEQEIKAYKAKGAQ